VFLTHQSVLVRKALPVKVSHSFVAGSAVFDDDHLVSCAGLVPVMTLAEQTGLTRLLSEKVRISAPRIKSGSANTAPKLATVVAGMCAGADCIDDVDVLRSGGMKTLFDGVYAPSTVGTLLREFTFGHARQLESVLREHLVALCGRVDLLPGADQRVFIDIDSLLRPVYGHAKQGASYGHTKIAGKQILRKGLSPLATTISTAHCAPVIAGMRLRAGKTGSGKGAGRMVAQAIGTARAAGVSGQILVRGDSAYGSRKVVRACLRADARFSLVMTRNPAIERAIAAIAETAWTPVSYPGAVRDPDTGAWISDAEVAEIPYTAFASTPDRITARLVVRRVKDACYPNALFPVWRYHPFFTNTDLPVDQADITHRQHAIIETVFADLIDGPLAHIPSGRFGANSAWALCSAIAHNLLRATGVLAGEQHTRARGSTLRRKIVNVPARLARPQRRPILHLPTHWPWSRHWLALWHNTIGHSPPLAATP
jgi:Transposase DDE domain group 1